jgi:hypothetical protein
MIQLNHSKTILIEGAVLILLMILDTLNPEINYLADSKQDQS